MGFDIMIHTQDPSTQEVDVGGLCLLGKLGLHSKALSPQQRRRKKLNNKTKVSFIWDLKTGFQSPWPLFFLAQKPTNSLSMVTKLIQGVTTVAQPH